jgi:hypothetical protein
VAQVVEHLPSKPEALSSNPNTTKTKRILTILKQQLELTFKFSGHEIYTNRLFFNVSRIILFMVITEIHSTSRYFLLNTVSKPQT